MILSSAALLMSMVFALLALFMIYTFFIAEKDPIITQEVNRLYENGLESDENWHSHGRSFTRGIVMTIDKEDGSIDFVNQSKLAGAGLL